MKSSEPYVTPSQHIAHSEEPDKKDVAPGPEKAVLWVKRHFRIEMALKGGVTHFWRCP